MDFNVRDRASEWSSMAGNAFSSLRDKIGGNRNNGANDNYDNYDDYGYDEYGYDDNSYDSYNAYDNPYDEYSYNYDEDAPKAPSYGRSGSNGGVKYPSLVTAEDIRVSTHASERIRRENAAAGYDEPAPRQPVRSNVSYMDPSYDPEVSASARNGEGSQRSRGYDSLFTPTSNLGGNVGGGLGGNASSGAASNVGSSTGSTYAAARPVQKTDDERISTRPAGYVSTTATSTSSYGGASYDPYATYQGAGSVSHTPTRTLKIVSPTSYADVETVSRALKAGDVVVLQLKLCASDLSKRVLDFSFGVASALDARVDCVADKVFVIARGNALTAAERQSLTDQGVL